MPKPATLPQHAIDHVPPTVTPGHFALPAEPANAIAFGTIGGSQIVHVAADGSLTQGGFLENGGQPLTALALLT